MNNINEIRDALIIGLIVATFLLNSSRALKAVELLKECLILLNNTALKKEYQLVIRTIYKSVYGRMFDGYRLINDCTNAIKYGSKLLVLHRESGERNKEGMVTFILAKLYQKQGKYQEAKKTF